MFRWHGNTANKGGGTNVFKLFEAVDVENTSDIKQLVIYDDGVGTSSLAPIRHFTGAAGAGLARNVRQLYRTLSLCYEPGDRIYLIQGLGLISLFFNFSFDKIIPKTVQKNNFVLNLE